MKTDLDTCILKAYYYLGKKTKGQFSYCSQKAMLKILKDWYNTSICRRTLNYHLRKLENNGHLKRIRRHKKGPFGKIKFHTTLVIIQNAGREALRSLAKWFRKNDFNNWTIKNFDIDAPKTEMQAELVATFIKSAYT